MEAPGPLFDAQLAHGHLAFQRCERCGEAIFFPRVLCPSCGSQELAWTTSEGRGVVYSTTVVRRRAGSHNVSLVDLEDGIRLMGEVVGLAPDEVRIGMAVQARVAGGEGGPAVVFEARG